MGLFFLRGHGLSGMEWHGQEVVGRIFQVGGAGRLRREGCSEFAVATKTPARTAPYAGIESARG